LGRIDAEVYLARASVLLGRDLKRIRETGDAFFNDRSHQTIIMPAEILFPVISDLSIRQPTRKETLWQNLTTSSGNVRKNWPRKKRKRKKEPQAGKQGGFNR